jgi:hypothetical protein
MKKPVRKAKIDGLPRTASAAKRRGHKKVDVDFDKLTENQKSKWATLAATTGISHGDFGRVGPAPGGGRVVCYYDKNTRNYDICYEV